MRNPSIPSSPPLPRLSALSLCLAAAFAAQAQTAAPSVAKPQTLDTVVVIGQGANLRGALDKQRAAQGVLSAVQADGIGQLPDNNAAEALARLPGVSVERDQGEGRFIRVRGLGPDYNAVTINGVQMPAAESDRRAAGLDVVPVGLIRSLEVHKTLSPEQDANSLGGTVAVNTLSAFDQPGRLFVVDLGANHDVNAGKTRPRGNLTFADRLAGGSLGVALALSADERRFASDNVETGGAWKGGKLGAFELRRYEITRQRLGAALNLDYKPEAGMLLYARGFSSRFTDEEQRQSNKISFASAQAEGAVGDASAVRGLKAREEINRASALSLGTELQRAEWKLWAEAGSARASEDKPDALASSAFKGSFKGVGFSDSVRPALLASTTGLNEAAGYSFDKLKLQDSRAEDRTRHAKLDLQREFALDGGLELTLKGGIKASRRDKRNELETYAVSAKQLAKAPYSLGKSQLGLAAFLGEAPVDYAWGSFGPGIAQDKLRALVAPLKRSDFRDAIDSQINDSRMQENVDAGYLQGQFERGGMQLLAGLRHERIRFEASGFAADGSSVKPVASNSGSSHWLPALLLRQTLNPQTLLRAAWTNSVVRPSFGQLNPGVVIDGGEAELGNPALKPLRSRNLDLGVEQALGRDGSLSAYLFHKQIRDFAFQTDLAGTGPWKDFSSVITFANGDTARLHGLELSYSQALRELPAPWNGLVLGANAAFVRSKATIGGYDKGVWKTRQIALPSQSDRSVNLSLGWEGSGISTRLALNHKSDYLLEVGSVFDPAGDLKVAGQNQLDFSLRYQLDRRWQISFEALNLGNEKYYVYQADKARNAQYEQYGRSFKLGLKLAVY